MFGFCRPLLVLDAAVLALASGHVGVETRTLLTAVVLALFAVRERLSLNGKRSPIQDKIRLDAPHARLDKGQPYDKVKLHILMVPVQAIPGPGGWGLSGAMDGEQGRQTTRS